MFPPSTVVGGGVRVWSPVEVLSSDIFGGKEKNGKDGGLGLAGDLILGAICEITITSSACLGDKLGKYSWEG